MAEFEVKELIFHGKSFIINNKWSILMIKIYLSEDVITANNLKCFSI